MLKAPLPPDQLWGALDITPSAESNFPGWRKIAGARNKDTAVSIIPRENGKVRLYVELGSSDGHLDPVSGRLDVSKFSPPRLLEAGSDSSPLVLDPLVLSFTRLQAGLSIHTRSRLPQIR